MDKLFSRENLEGLFSYGWLFPVGLGLLILLVYGKTIFPAIIGWVNDLKKGKATKDKINDLIYHSFFYNVNIFLTIKIPSFNFKRKRNAHFQSPYLTVLNFLLS